MSTNPSFSQRVAQKVTGSFPTGNIDTKNLPSPSRSAAEAACADAEK